MVSMEGNRLEFRFPEVHEDAVCTVEFQRTLRLPDDNREYPLPPGLGKFPLFHVADYNQRVPEKWNQRGGVFLPMYQSEALWINFDSIYPFAIKIAAGKVNAVTGQAWSNEINADPQDYLVLPEQPWLDGFAVQKGLIRQFVAMPLGKGYTAEEQIFGEAEFGGIQIIAYPIKAALWEKIKPVPPKNDDNDFEIDCCMSWDCRYELDMGLAPGGLMHQEIYDDDYGFDAWETCVTSRCFVHLVNSLQFKEVTGIAPPSEPPSVKDYTEAGLPWFEYYGYEKKVLDGSATLAQLHSVAAMQVQMGEHVLGANEPVKPSNIKKLGSKTGYIKDGVW